MCPPASHFHIKKTAIIKMNKSFLLLVFLYLAFFNVEALNKKKSLGSNSFNLETVTPPPNPNHATFLEAHSATTDFELINFYEDSFYFQAYVLYNEYVLNTGLTCNNAKKIYGFSKKLDATALGNFCKLIAGQINSSYLGTYLCAYILGEVSWFAQCSA